MATKRFASAADAEEWLSSDELGLAVFQRVAEIVQERGGAELRVAVTQLGWARRRGFAYLWSPQRWLAEPDAEVVLALDLPRHDASPRWQQVVPVRSGRFMHHLELRTVAEVDDEVAGWVIEAYDDAG
jgi:hypothetical protein